MYNRCNKTIIKALKQDEVYIIKYILKNFNEFVLISVMHTSHSEIVFSVAASNISSYVHTYEHSFMTDFLNVNIILLNRRVKIFRL